MEGELLEACRNGNFDAALQLIFEGHCDPRTVSDQTGWTPLHYACKAGNLEFVRTLVERYSCDPQCRTHDGQAPLHMACKYAWREVVLYLICELRCDPNVTSTDGRTPHSVAQNPIIGQELIRYGANPKNVYTLYDSYLPEHCQKLPTEATVKLLIVGSPGTGKTTLLESLNKESKGLSRIIRRFTKVSGVDSQTAGIIPHTFNSRTFGSVTVYDFAGHMEYYSSHVAVIQQLKPASFAVIFLVIADLRESNENFRASILFWLYFIANQCTPVDPMSHIIIVGSHADVLKSRVEITRKSSIVLSLVHTAALDNLHFVGCITMDCRYAESSAISELRQHLARSSEALRTKSMLSFNTHCFYLYLKDVFQRCIAVQIKEVLVLFKSTECSTANTTKSDRMKLLSFIPTEFPDRVHKMCKDLNESGTILMLQNAEDPEESWIILNQDTLLSEVTGTIFSPEYFKEHRNLSTSTGVVPFSKLQAYFPSLNADMIAQLLCHLEFCQEVTDDEVFQLLTSIPLSGVERFYFFPSLVTITIPFHAWNPNDDFVYHSGWVLQCSQPEHFFTSRFIQVLLLRLTFSFALIPDTQEIKEDLPAIQRECDVWKSGIYWHNRRGVGALVEVDQSKIVTVLLRCLKRSEIECIHLRSAIIHKVLCARKELCPRVSTSECFIHPSDAIQYPIKSAAELTVFKMSEVAGTIASAVPWVRGNNNLLVHLEDLLYYEPYAHLGESILQELFDEHNPNYDKVITDDFFYRMADSIHTKIDYFIEMFELPGSMLQDMLEQAPPRSTHALVRVFQLWRLQSSKGSYRCLHYELDQFSVFAGRNPLDLTVDVLSMDETTPDFKLQKAFHQIKKQFKLACIEGDIQKLQKLIMTATTDGILQALVNGITGKNGWTPLMYAIKSGHLKVIKRLVESEVVELEAKNKKNYTALLLACEHEQLEVVKYLLEMGSDPCACASKYEKHESGEGTGITGLHLAAISNSSEIAEELINSKCPLHIQDTEGNTALHLAYKNSSTDVADFLQRVPGGKQLQSMTNKFGQTPSQVPPEIFIPPEIIARGLVPAYRKALKKGKQKYYRCSLLILGEVEAGKTSLLNLLTHKPFQQDLPRTEGIEDTVVDTGVWKNQQQADQIKKNRELFACGVVKALPSRENPLPTTIPKETPLPTVLEQPLPQTFEDIKTDYKPISEVMVAEDKFTQDSVTVIKKPEQHSLTVSSKKPSAEAIVSRSEADIIERILKLGETKELYLNLKVYDFAGDWKYRSMHHCYITPHALYLVVFDLQKVSKCSLADKSKTLEEIRYWLNSIHAHIHTTSKREDSLGWRKDQSEEKRVILVGTHMAPKDIRQGKPLTDDDLNEVDKMLSTEFYHKDTRYLGDIWYTGKKRRMFVAVECSRDKPDEREESGVLFLQNQLLEATAQLSFLNRLHPVVWLKFENELKRMRERNCSIVQLESIQIVGRKSGVEDVEAVLKYFHDIGTIIYPKLLPCLFLSNEELRQRDGYIVLDPKWLMTVMQNVMELQRGAGQSVMKYRGYEVDIQKLKKTGIVTIALLKKCWECHTAPDSFAQLCLILQSYGLICTYIDQNCDDIHHYLIPCKLPPKFPEHPLVGNRIITFYFDFEGFLPSVIFHRFICLMSMESNPDRESHFSDRCCRVYTKQGWTMQLDFETHFQRLKVSVVTSKEDKLPPINYVSVIHKEFLHKICKNSGLEGLKFTGGPMFKCKTGCKVDTRDKCMYLLPCVKYSVRHPEIQDCLEQVCCTGTCGETYNANHWLLNPMDQDLCNSGADSSDAVLNKPLGSCEDGAHKRLTHRRDKIIQYLATFVSPERLADKLVAAGLITDDTRNKALVPAATIQDRIRPMIDVIIIMTELNSAKYDKFIEVLKEFRALEDVIKFIESPVDIMPVEQ